MGYLNVSYTLLCPSLPVNHRTVKNGVLYVNGTKLSQSPLKNHPLNPMWDSYIPNLMKEQSKYPCYVVNRKEILSLGRTGLEEKYATYNKRYYLVPDYENEHDAKLLAEQFGESRLLTGGSGLLAYLPMKISRIDKHDHAKKMQRTIVLCGSCSAITRKQVHYYQRQHGQTYAVDAQKLLAGTLTADDIWRYVEKQEKPVLIYSDAIDKDMEKLRSMSAFSEAAEWMEALMKDLSRKALMAGFRRIIVGGGETSGAVIEHLGFDGFTIGRSIDPGVPELIPLNDPEMTLILKSGNFGAEDFFVKAVSGNE